MGFYHYDILWNTDIGCCPNCGSNQVHRILFWQIIYSWAALIRFLMCVLSLFSLWFTAYLPWLTGISGAEIVAEIVDGTAYRNHILPILLCCIALSYILIGITVRSFYPADCNLHAIRCTSCKKNLLIQRRPAKNKES